MPVKTLGGCARGPCLLRPAVAPAQIIIFVVVNIVVVPYHIFERCIGSSELLHLPIYIDALSTCSVTRLSF